MGSYNRFNDDNYKNWLKTTESLRILRTCIRPFVENETKTYHNSLQNKINAALKGAICQDKCDVKKWKQAPKNKKSSPVCATCIQWTDEILADHKAKGNGVYWNNCLSHRWPTEKWEVAKVFMPNGHKDHVSYDQFDIAAILNFMNFCNYFRKFVKCLDLEKVITVRNKTMHSPDFRLSKVDCDGHLQKILELGRILEHHVPEMETLAEEILKFSVFVGKQLGPVGPNGGGEEQCDWRTVTELQRFQDLELQALKEKIESLAQRSEEDQDGDLKEELQGMRNFLDQNMDLLEKLGPQVALLKEVQEKVDQHEKQINVLNVRVDHLERGTHDPIFSRDPLKYKNHLLEEAKKNKWPDPVFSEFQEATGYRGQVVVIGQTFTGTQVCNNVKTAHQEVAKIALDHLKAQPKSTEEPSHCPLEQSDSVSTSGSAFFGSVTVVLDTDVAAGAHQQEEGAIESAYKELAVLFGLEAPMTGSSIKTTVLEHFGKSGFPLPVELLDTDPDKKIHCKLKLKGHFIFQDQDGATKKKLAEHQAAKAALLQLSGVLRCTAVTGDNYKGFLKERLEALNLEIPSYSVSERGGAASGEPAGPAPIMASSAPVKSQKCEGSATPDRAPQATQSVSSAVPTVAEPRDSSPRPSQREVAKMDQPGYGGQVVVIGQTFTDTQVCNNVKTAHQEVAKIALDHLKARPKSTEEPSHCPLEQSDSVSTSGSAFFGSVTVVLDTDVAAGVHQQEEGAIESAYKELVVLFGLEAPMTGSSIKTTVLEHFGKSGFPLPVELLDTDPDKKIHCKLKLKGHFIFQDQDGATKKKLAEHQAAKAALLQLSGVLRCTVVTGDNYKGFLKERLEALNLESPSYSVSERGGAASGEPAGPAPIMASSAPVKSQKCEGSATPDRAPQPTGSVSSAVPSVAEPRDSSPRPSQREVAKMDQPALCPPEIETLLTVFGLLPPLVTCASFSMDQRFKCTVNIALDQYTFENKGSYSSKKEATRKTYLLFGLAVGICQPNTDEPTKAVKQYFQQKCLPHPVEAFGGEEKAFSCSLKGVKCNFGYEGHGSEEEARQVAFLEALARLAPLFGFESLPKSSSSEEAEARLTAMLKGANQDPAHSVQSTQHRASIQLRFSDYAMESKGQSSKKSARNQLCTRILGLLGEKADPSCVSVRNCLDDWFKQKELQQPVFEDIDGVLGAKATFSASFSCACLDWQDSCVEAERALVLELQARMKHLTD